MKHILYILTVVFCLGITACQRHTAYPPAMQQAEALMDTRPDSALLLLESMADTLDMLPEEARMYHHLLTIQAKDKQYITHTGDSLINRIVAFYEESGDKDRLMMAYFYQGSTYRDMNDAPRALKAFQQAVDLNVPNLDLLAKTYNQMGKLFMYQGLHDEVIRVNRKAMEAYLSLGKRNKISYFQRDIARMYDMKDMPDSALHYYKEACRTALADGDSVRYYDLIGELGGFYFQIDSLVLAKKALLTSLTNKEEHKCSNLFPYIAYIYESESQWDSVQFYYDKALLYGNTRQKYYTFQNLFNLANGQGKTAEANYYIKEALSLKERLDKTQQTETIAKINALYNYQHTEQENYLLKIKQSQQNEWLLGLAILLLLFIMICFAIVLYMNKREKERKSLKQKLVQMEQERHSRSAIAIEENKQEIMKLDEELIEKKTEERILESKLLEVQKNRLNLKNQDIEESQKEQDLRMKILKQSSVYKRFHWAAAEDSIKITVEDWNSLEEEIEKAYPGFISRLHDLYPELSVQGVQICLLTKASIAPADIARVIGRSRSAINLACRRYYEKIHQERGSAEMFRTFIEQL